MRDLVHNLRQRPHHHRQAVALGTAVAVTSMVALVWMVTISGKFTGFEGTPASAGTALEESGLSVSAGREKLQQTFESARAQFEQAQLGAAHQSD